MGAHGLIHTESPFGRNNDDPNEQANKMIGIHTFTPKERRTLANLHTSACTSPYVMVRSSPTSLPSQKKATCKQKIRGHRTAGGVVRECLVQVHITLEAETTMGHEGAPMTEPYWPSRASDDPDNCSTCWFFHQQTTRGGFVLPAHPYWP